MRSTPHTTTTGQTAASGSLSAPVVPDIPEPVVVDDGRIGWPDVFVYLWSTDIEEHATACPPPKGRPYRVLVKQGQLAVYERLSRDGWLRSPEHTGVPHTEMIDNRAAPGA